MRSKIIESQLKQCTFANLNNFDESTNTFLIKRYEKPKYTIGKCYLIKLPKSIIGNTTSILASN